MFKAKHRQTGKKVALKKVLMENEKEGVRKHGTERVGLWGNGSGSEGSGSGPGGRR